MKTLQDFLFEQLLNESDESKSVTFDFKDLENGEEELKKFAENEFCEIEETKLTVKVTKDNANKLNDVQDELKQYCTGIRSSTRRASDEQYAQKTRTFQNKVNELNEIIKNFLSSDTDPKDDIKQEEKDTKKEEE